MIGALFKHPEGPPSDEDMQNLAADLLYEGKIERANRLSAVMVEHWKGLPIQTLDLVDRARHFSFWLGYRSATAQILIGRDHRRGHHRRKT